jgi:DNA mismatch repair protein MutL
MINMIAAGEVIERPSSVVKELVENSLDAGASRIDVTVEQGGTKLIRIADNGQGMSSEDLNLAFQPHATSKLRNPDNLNNISTMGFRGEALASIASVATVSAVTRNADAVEATRIDIDCGKISGPAPASADCGTTMEVRDLFYKVPARRKFLKTPATEFGHISEFFTRIALAWPEVAMSLTHNKKKNYSLSSCESVEKRIKDLFGNDITNNIIHTKRTEKNINIQAWLGKPEICRTNNKYQYIFVNGRYIRDKFIGHAIKEAYRGTIENNRYPVVFLFIKMPPDELDVNVHPTKIEVRFANSNLLHSQVLSCLREKLLATDMDAVGSFSTSNTHKTKVAQAMTDFFKNYKNANSQPRFTFKPSISQNAALPFKTAGLSKTIPSTTDFTHIEIPNFIQIHNSFIVVEDPDGFSIIDQHALHERIIYEELCKRVSNNKIESQKLLVPQSFGVSDSEAALLDANGKLIKMLGLEVSRISSREMAVMALPNLLRDTDPVEFCKDLITILQKNPDKNTSQLFDTVLHMTACKAAIKAGQELTKGEIQHLLEKKSVTEHSSRCPHGRPTTIRFTLSELEKQFKRT